MCFHLVLNFRYLSKSFNISPVNIKGKQWLGQEPEKHPLICNSRDFCVKIFSWENLENGDYPKNLERLLASTTGSLQASNVPQIPWYHHWTVHHQLKKTLYKSEILFLTVPHLRLWSWKVMEKICTWLTSSRIFRSFDISPKIGWWQLKEVLRQNISILNMNYEAALVFAKILAICPLPRSSNWIQV